MKLSGFGGTEAAVGLSDGLPTVNPFEFLLEGSQQPGISQRVSNSYFWLNVPKVGNGYNNSSSGSNAGSCSGSSGGSGCASNYGANQARYQESSSFNNHEFNNLPYQSFFDSNDVNWTENENQEMSYFDTDDSSWWTSEQELWNYYINDPDWNNFINDTNWWNGFDSEFPVSVPEPTSALGLFVLGAWGIIKAMKIRCEK